MTGKANFKSKYEEESFISGRGVHPQHPPPRSAPEQRSGKTLKKGSHEVGDWESAEIGKQKLGKQGSYKVGKWESRRAR